MNYTAKLFHSDKFSLPYKEVIKIFLLIYIGGYFVYELRGTTYNFVYFTFLFTLYYRSKNDVFWIALFWIILTYPWGMFYYRESGWYFQLTSRVGIDISSIIPFIILIKTYKRKTILFLKDDLFRRYYKFIVFMLFFLFLWGAQWGFSMRQIAMLMTYLPGILFFIVVPRLFSYAKLLKFNSIIFLFTSIFVVSSIFDIIGNGVVTKFISFGFEHMPGTAIVTDGDSTLVRQIGGIYLCFYSMILSLYYIINAKNEFSGLYLWLNLILSILFIINSATRGWMLATFFIIIIFIFRYTLKIQLLPKFIGGIIVGAAVFTLLSTEYIDNLMLAFERFSTVKAVAEGDFTAEDTAHRWDERGPAVLARFNESPIFGFGLSAISAEYYDKHVGNHVLLLISGVFGFVLLYILIIAILRYIYKLAKIVDKSIFIFCLAILSILIIHATSREMISYLMPTDSAFFLALIFNHINASYFLFRSPNNE